MIFLVFAIKALTLSLQMFLSYRNQSIDLRSKSIDWNLYDKGLRHERVNQHLYPRHFRGVFRTQSNIYDGVFFAKEVRGPSSI